MVCKINCEEYNNALTKNKPMIIVFNHINFLEIPVLIVFSYPIKVTGLAKQETWKNPFFAFLFNSFKAIPINRGGAFTEAFKQVQERIRDGYFMCISPEGTRHRDGVLGRGKAGVIQLALETSVPILPVAHYGGENLLKNIKRFKRTPVCLKPGIPFRIKFEGRPGREEREEIISEVMGQIAKLLPEQMRGVYADQAEKDCKYLEFI